MSEKNSNEKTTGWLLPDAKPGSLAPGLYIVATPIGNLGDMSLRALDVLAAVDEILCEDTRVSGKLLKHFGLRKTLCVYNDHSDESQRAQILSRIENGEALALVSDAGMPLVSDPGYKLVRALRDADLYVTSIPGANAPLAALQLSGLPADAFSFIGFLPPKKGARQAVLAAWKDAPGTLLAFETAPRLKGALEDVAETLPGRRVAVVREITKLYEEVRMALPEELLLHYEAQGGPKGEIVLVIEPAPTRVYTQSELEAMLKDSLETMSTKKAAADVAARTGHSKTQLYDLALKVEKK